MMEVNEMTEFILKTMFQRTTPVLDKNAVSLKTHISQTQTFFKEVCVFGKAIMSTNSVSDRHPE